METTHLVIRKVYYLAVSEFNERLNSYAKYDSLQWTGVFQLSKKSSEDVREKKIITVTSESQLAAKIVLHAFLHASYPEARSIGMMLIICRSSWLLLSKNENVKKGKKGRIQ